METTLSALHRRSDEALQGVRFGWERSNAPRRVDRAWHTLLSELIYFTDALERLLQLARRGCARQLRTQPQLQVDAVTWIDGMIRDTAQHGTTLFGYVHQNFGDLAPVRTRRRLLLQWLLEALMPLIGAVLTARPALALLLIQCYKKLAVHYLTALGLAAFQHDRTGLARLIQMLRENHEHHLSGLNNLLSVTPMGNRIDRLLGRLMLAWWHADAVTALEGPTDPTSSRAHLEVGFDLPGYRTRIEHVRQQAASLCARRGHPPARLREELERLAL